LARFEIESENHELTDLTGTGMVMGTIDYMAPEQSLDTRTADARSDIYSLGCTFWYLLTGKSVYDGDTLMKKLLAHRENEIPSLQKMFASVPAVVDDVFQKMIAKDQTDRYQSMGEVVDALQDCLTEKSSSGSSSDLSMAVGPKLASFLADVDVPKVTSAKLEYEDSKSHTAAEQATVIGQAGDGVAPTLSRSMKAISTGKLPKWVYGV
jgi:serine/threonine protein kinase